jgi:hypothetical protein
VVLARSEANVLTLDGRWRTPILGPALALLAVSFVGLVANRAEAAARSAAARSDWSAAAKQAQRAGSWAPWSAEALVLEADAAAGTGRRADAVALLRRAVRKDSTDFQAWRELASLSSGAERKVALARVDELDPLR